MAGWVQSASGNFFSAPFVPQAVAGSAEAHKVFSLVAASLAARFDVMYFEEARSVATRGLAAVFVPCQHFSAYAGRDCGGVSASVFADGGITAHSFGLGYTQFAFAGIGLDGHAARFYIFVNMDLDRRSTHENPPGGPFMCPFLRFRSCAGFIRNFHLSDFQ